jgi:uncharacterized protein (DUF302 family)
MEGSMNKTTGVTRATEVLRKSWIVSLLAIALPASVTGQMTPPPDFLVTVSSSRGFDETLSLLKQAIEGENLMVIQEINPQQMLRLVGMRVGGMRQILFFHPRYMQQIFEANRNGGIEPPLKILVMERPDGSVAVRYHDPVHMYAPYQGLDGIAAEFKDIFERVVAKVQR